MTFENELQKVLWHELGHLCIDLIEYDTNSNFKINFFSVQYNPNATFVKWGGSVNSVYTNDEDNKYYNLIKDLNRTSLFILNKFSGCVFETIFKNNFLNENTDFENCFKSGLASGAGNDYATFCDFSKNYLKCSININKLNNEFVNYLSEDTDFIQKMNDLTIEYKNIILEDYNAKKESFFKPYEFKIDGKYLQTLTKKTMHILSTTSLKNNILKLKKMINDEVVIKN